MRHLEGYSQDTTCLPNVYLRNALKRIEQGKADSMELRIRKDEIKDWMALAEQRRTSIVNLQEHVNTVELRMLNYKEQAEIWEKALKKQKRKTILTTVAGIGVTASLTFLLIAFK